MLSSIIKSISSHLLFHFLPSWLQTSFVLPKTFTIVFSFFIFNFLIVSFLVYVYASGLSLDYSRISHVEITQKFFFHQTSDSAKSDTVWLISTSSIRRQIAVRSAINKLTVNKFKLFLSNKALWLIFRIIGHRVEVKLFKTNYVYVLTQESENSVNWWLRYDTDAFWKIHHARGDLSLCIFYLIDFFFAPKKYIDLLTGLVRNSFYFFPRIDFCCSRNLLKD